MTNKTLELSADIISSTKDISPSNVSPLPFSVLFSFFLFFSE